MLAAYNFNNNVLSQRDRQKKTDRKRQTQALTPEIILPHSTIEIVHTCTHNTKTNQVMKIIKSTKYCLLLILKVPSDTGLCNAAGRLFHNKLDSPSTIMMRLYVTYFHFQFYNYELCCQMQNNLQIFLAVSPCGSKIYVQVLVSA